MGWILIWPKQTYLKKLFEKPFFIWDPEWWTLIGAKKGSIPLLITETFIVQQIHEIGKNSMMEMVADASGGYQIGVCGQ